MWTGKNSVVVIARTLDGGPGQWPASESTPEKKDLAVHKRTA
jgi:hypothetical protein